MQFTPTQEEIMKRHLTTIVVLALSITLFLALAGEAFAGGSFRH
jgi:hypothetical protein